MSRTRYITLMGDPIYSDTKSPVRGMLHSHDTTAMSIAAGYSVSIDYPTSDILLNNFFMAIFLRQAEKLSLSRFNALARSDSSLNTDDLVIDTNPDPELAKHSMVKYHSAIQNTKGFHKMLFSASVIGTPVLLGVVSYMAKLPFPFHVMPFMYANLATFISRTGLGLKTMNKLESGEWAVVSRPPPKEIPDKEFNLNFDLELGDTVPQAG